MPVPAWRFEPWFLRDSGVLASLFASPYPNYTYSDDGLLVLSPAIFGVAFFVERAYSG